MVGFGIEYHIAIQILGMNPRTSVFALIQSTPEAFKYDLRVWIWKSAIYQWTFKNVDVSESIVFTMAVCNNPYIEGLFFVFADGRMSVLYPQARTPGTKVLEMEMLHLSEAMDEELVISACYDEGWRKVE